MHTDGARGRLACGQTHAKALYRRAKALAAQGEGARARADLRVLLTAQPSNSAARTLLESLPAEPVVV